MKRKRKQRRKEEAEAGAAACDNEADVDTGGANARDDAEDKNEGEGESSEGEGEDNDNMLDLEFDFRDPCEEDYHTVSELLKSGTWEFVEPNFSELTDSMVGQGNIGTLIKAHAEGDDDTELESTCGIYTTLNLRQFAHLSWPRDIGNALIAKAKKHADAKVVEKLQSLLHSHAGTEVGLLFHERFMNMPLELVPPLHQALLDDIKWSCTTPDCPEDERPFYRFTHFVGVTRCYGGAQAAAALGEASSSTQVVGKPAVGKRKKCRGRAQSREDGQNAAGLNFAQDEDEFYVRKAEFSFTFPVVVKKGKEGPTVRGRGQEQRMVFGITRRAFEEAVANIKKAFAERCVE